MPELTATDIVFGMFGAAAIGFASYFAVRFMKGRIRLTLPRTAYKAGDTIKGSFDLECKKPIESNGIVVTLVGTRKTTVRQGNSRSTVNETLFRDEQLIAPAKSYPSGTKETHSFELATPKPESATDGNGYIKAASWAFSLITGGRRYSKISWYVKVHLDADGIDLATRKRVSVNTGGRTGWITGGFA